VNNIVPLSLHATENGVKAQWAMADDLVIAGYKQHGEHYALMGCFGPWSELSKPTPNPKTWVVEFNDKYKKERQYVFEKAIIILECLNAKEGGVAALKKQFGGPVINFDDFPIRPTRDFPQEVFEPDEEEETE